MHTAEDAGRAEATRRHANQLKTHALLHSLAEYGATEATAGVSGSIPFGLAGASGEEGSSRCRCSRRVHSEGTRLASLGGRRSHVSWQLYQRPRIIDAPVFLIFTVYERVLTVARNLEAANVIRPCGDVAHGSAIHAHGGRQD